MGNGLKNFRLHRGAGIEGAALESLSAVSKGVAESITSTDPETAARRYLRSMFDGADTILPIAVDVAQSPAEFKYLGVDKISFTATQHVKFRQYLSKIPIYGSLVTVELGPENDFVSINTSVGDPSDIDPVATLSPSDAIRKVKDVAGYGDEPLNEPVRLHFYFDQAAEKWRLVYIVEDVLRLRPRDESPEARRSAVPESSDFIIDAHDGAVIDELPRTQTAAEEDATEQSADVLQDQRTIGILRNIETNSAKLHDRKRNTRTHDFEFRDAMIQQARLPGRFVSSPPTPWDPGAVSAHANATEVVDFLSDILGRDGLDNAGGQIVSSVNCVYQTEPGEREWRNAARFRGQMIYGQRMVDGALRSYAASLDVVAHELLHGLTENTARLEYRFQSGALNESLSDIFGVIISNFHESDVTNWNWQIGEDLDETGLPLRDMSNPEKFDQPAHMDAYRSLPEYNDHGGVHTNSGIHNRAAFNLLTAFGPAGAPIFTPVEVARMYYVALVAHLSRTSGFADCRAAMLLATQTMFAADANAAERIAAVEAAYDAVGIGPNLTS